MLFKKLRSFSSSTSKKSKIERVTSLRSETADTESRKSTARVIARETSDDYQTFLENAKKEAEAKEKAVLKMAKEAERRRREFNMDPWASRF